MMSLPSLKHGSLLMTLSPVEPSHRTDTLYTRYRASKRDGGVAILCKVDHKVTKLPSIKASSFESTSVCISCRTCTTRVVVIYPPPSSSTTVFMSEFASLLDNLFLDPKKFLSLGNFNYYLNECTADAACLADLLASYDLQQRIH